MIGDIAAVPLYAPLGDFNVYLGTVYLKIQLSWKLDNYW